jgi:ribosomal 30S subunit maturation factor RimM
MNDVLGIEVVKAVEKFGKVQQILKRLDKDKWVVERTGNVLQVVLNLNGIVVVVNDNGNAINKTPLSIYLKGLISGQKLGLMGSRVK